MVANDQTLDSKQKSEYWKTCTHLHYELDSFPKFRGFSNETGELTNVIFWYYLIKCVDILVVLPCCTFPSCSPNYPKPKCYQWCFFSPLKTSLPYYSGVIVSFQYLQNLKQIVQCHVLTFKEKKIFSVSSTHWYNQSLWQYQ